MTLGGVLAWSLAAVAICRLDGAEPAQIEPVSVCEVISHLKDFEDKAVAVLGRYSLRQNGRWLSEDKCAEPLEGDGVTWPAALSLATDSAAGPKLAATVAVNQAKLDEKLRAIQKVTVLARFRFGSADYDRWGMVYGRLELKPALKRGEGFGSIGAPARLVHRGDAEVFFFAER